jgi:hypothetical protein
MDLLTLKIHYWILTFDIFMLASIYRLIRLKVCASYLFKDLIVWISWQEVGSDREFAYRSEGSDCRVIKINYSIYALDTKYRHFLTEWCWRASWVIYGLMKRHLRIYQLACCSQRWRISRCDHRNHLFRLHHPHEHVIATDMPTVLVLETPGLPNGPCPNTTDLTRLIFRSYWL